MRKRVFFGKTVSQGRSPSLCKSEWHAEIAPLFSCSCPKVSSNLFHFGEIGSILRWQQMAPSQIIQLSFSFSRSFRCLGWQLSVGFLHSASAQLTTQRYLPDRNSEECRHFGDTLLIFQSPDHVRETLCLADLWINLCTIWTNQEHWTSQAVSTRWLLDS